MKRCVLPFLFASLLSAQTGAFRVYMIWHPVGQERYTVTRTPDSVTLNTTIEFTDRANTHTTSATLRMKRDYTPLELAIKDKPDSVKVVDGIATVRENVASRTFPAPDRYFTIFDSSPFAVQMMLLRYWSAHGKTAALPVLRSSANAEPLRIKQAGQDTIALNGKNIHLSRYTVTNLAFGREIVWTNGGGDLVAVMTFAGGLPMEALREGYQPVFPQLYRSGVAQEMADLKLLARQVPPQIAGAFAIRGATLVDLTGAPAVEDSIVLVRNGLIAAAGSGASTQIPRGTRIVEAKGLTLLPGLWEMHTHASGVEFGPALLAAGITTARDCGGEFDYLVALREAAAKGHVPCPRILLAGLVDAGGLKAFGAVIAETPEQGRAVVDRYHAAGFQQIKLYTYLTPDVVEAICAAAHHLGMTVTGHVPQALSTFAGIEAGMDQINHLNYVSNMLRPPGDPHGSIDLNSAVARNAIAFLKAHRTVVDPTIGWGEMAGHSKEVNVASYEPGILHAPFVLDAKFRGLGSATTNAIQMKAHIAQNLDIVQALHRAGVPIVPGSDTGLPGYGLLRELELYVQAGFTPLEAIQSATIVSARAMGLDRDSGTIEPGKRADLILVSGKPLIDISDLRKVKQVVIAGRMYDSGELWKSVGFHP